MNDFDYRDGELFVEQLAVTELAEQFGTPGYIYSRATLERNFRAYQDALAGTEHLVCYAVKSNSNLAVLSTLARLGAGFDIVSCGELARIIAAGGDAAKVVYSGVAKTAADMRTALEAGILCFNIESEKELHRLNEVARSLGRTARISVRVNPDVDAGTHPYIATGLRENKFGIEMEAACAVYQLAAGMDHIEVVGVNCHIGSQLTEISPFIDALQRLLDMIDRLGEAGIPIHHLDLGGGLGVRYRHETPPPVSEYIAAVRRQLQGRSLTLMFEPGRSISAEAGILLTRVDSLKFNSQHNFAIVDAAMNDMLRPALYQAWLDIVPVRLRQDAPTRVYDIVGPVCETGDFLGRQRQLAIMDGDLLAVLGAGAYGFAMSSNYNSRGRAAEVLVDGDKVHLARARETLEDQLRGEVPLPDGH